MAKSRAVLGVLVLGAILYVAGTVRESACAGELWLDEIWSCTIAERLASPLDAITAVHEDNNHCLNTLVLYFLGPDRDYFLYRAGSLCAGVGAVLVAFLYARRRSPVAGFIAALVFAGSYLMVQYASEARGYAPAVLFVLVAQLFLEATLAQRDLVRDAVFGGACVLGVLAHPVFLMYYAAAVVWSAVRIARGAPGRAAAARRLFRLHLVPFGFAAWLYTIHIRPAHVGGGEHHGFWPVVGETLSLALGGPARGGLRIAASLVSAAVFLHALVVRARRDDDRWVLWLLGACAMPAAMIAASRLDFFFPRYFIVPVTLWYLVLSEWLADVWDAGPRGRGLVVAAVALVLVANGQHVARLVRLGRGAYLEPLLWMQAHARGATAGIGSDHDFRNRMLVEYYSRYVSPDGKPVEYFEREDWPRPRGPEWYIAHANEPDPAFPPTRRVGRVRYALELTTNFAGLSGTAWGVYHRIEPARP